MPTEYGRLAVESLSRLWFQRRIRKGLAHDVRKRFVCGACERVLFVVVRGGIAVISAQER